MKDTEIEKAYRAHNSVGDELKFSRIILSHSRDKIFHEVQSAFRENEKEEFLVSNIPLNNISNKKRESLVELENEWSKGGDHFLLKKILSENLIPTKWYNEKNISNLPTLKYSLELAKSRGYNVPIEYIQNAKLSYSEKEALYAAYMITRGECNFLRDDFLNKVRQFSRYQLCTITGEFIVPDPLDDSKVPYFIDQLWIVSEPNNNIKDGKSKRVRFICLEIDGEPHLYEDPERQKKRDLKLNELGYEVYHVAGWWCRIDPYKVICEFLAKAQLVEDLDKDPAFAHYCIPDYICDICHEPMIRWDVDSIETNYINGVMKTYHKFCSPHY